MIRCLNDVIGSRDVKSALQTSRRFTETLPHIQFYNTSIISLEAQVKAIALFCFVRETIEFDWNISILNWKVTRAPQ